MKFKWEPDIAMRTVTENDWDLLAEDGTHVAFVRHHVPTDTYVCRFMELEDNVFPDGKRYKTLKSAKAWCLKYAPVLYITSITRKAGDDDGTGVQMEPIGMVPQLRVA